MIPLHTGDDQCQVFDLLSMTLRWKRCHSKVLSLPSVILLPKGGKWIQSLPRGSVAASFCAWNSAMCMWGCMFVFEGCRWTKDPLTKNMNYGQTSYKNKGLLPATSGLEVKNNFWRSLCHRLLRINLFNSTERFTSAFEISRHNIYFSLTSPASFCLQHTHSPLH